MNKAQYIINLLESDGSIENNDIKKVFDPIFNKYNEKDYWDTKGTIDRQIKERDWYIQQGKLQMKPELEDEAIKKSVGDKTYNDMFSYTKKFVDAIENKNISFLKQQLHNRQTFILTFLNKFYNLSLKTDKDIANYIDSLKI